MLAPLPMCVVCQHYSQQGKSCAAYPDGIPSAIWDFAVDHRQPFAGDGGVRFAPDPAVDPAAVSARQEFMDEARTRLAAAGVSLPSR